MTQAKVLLIPLPCTT